MFLEIELKLSIDPDPSHIDLLFSHPLLMQSPPVFGHFVSRYFDTPDLRLWHQGLSLRIRAAEECIIQTLKTAGAQIDDVHHRYEWDQTIKDNVPAIHAFEDKEISQRLDVIIGDQPLIELFYTSFKRTQWNLHTISDAAYSSTDIENTQIELVLDQGTVGTATQHSPLHEIELELKQGKVASLHAVAAILKQTIPLTLETRSKAQRGYLLYLDNHLSAKIAGAT